jgi:hypothetical protein
MLYLTLKSLSVGTPLGQINDQYFNMLFGWARRYGRAGQAPYGSPITLSLE